jgi:hypothetical protein
LARKFGAKIAVFLSQTNFCAFDGLEQKSLINEMVEHFLRQGANVAIFEMLSTKNWRKNVHLLKKIVHRL